MLMDNKPRFRRLLTTVRLLFKRTFTKENFIKAILFLCALSSIGIVFFIVIYMVDLGYPVVIDWFAHGFESGVFNILPYMFDSLYLALGGTLLGVAIGVPCAIYLAEFADLKLRNMIKPTLEVLNGFPSVIIGLLGFTLLCTQLGRFGLQAMYCTLVGWVVLGVMSLPLIASVSEDSLRAVPQDLREASLGLGATKWQTTIDVLVPGAISGILTSVLLAFANAIGETMAVLAVIGILTPPPITLNPLSQSNSITALIAYGYQETSVGSLRYLTLFAAGFILFVMTALTNVAIRAIMANRNKTMATTVRQR
jgi:phosphate transport system permease protein